MAAAVAAQKSAAANAAAGAKPPALDVAAMARQIAEAKRLALASQATRAVQENPYLVSFFFVESQRTPYFGCSNSIICTSLYLRQWGRRKVCLSSLVLRVLG